MADLLDDEAVAEALPEGWHREGDEIVREFDFDSYLEGVGFAAGVGGVAESAFHHPELIIGYKTVEVRFTSHEAGGITDQDIALAEEVNGLV
ncbi:MAG: 4a-hydroxytetrahydrobiopterin dehydratase [Halobacteriaceae archaeon]